MAEPVRYTYDAAFQERILALLLREPAFLFDYGDVIEPSYFDREALTILARLTLKFFEGSGEVPNRDTMVEALKEYVTSYHVSDRIRGELEATLDRVYKLELSNAASVKERVIRFGQRQALKAATYEIADLLKKDDDYDRARSLIDSALHVGCGARELGFHLGDDLLKLPEMARQSSYAVDQKIATFWPTLDRYTHGGLARKEIWIIAAMSGIGKSTCLVQLGVSGLFAGAGVVHYTIGDLTDIDVGLRYASRLTGCTIPEIIHNDARFQERAAMRAKYQANLWIKHYSSGQATMGHVRSHLSRLVHVKGLVPGMIILDYPDELRIGDDLYRGVGDIYAEFQALCHEYNCLGLAASQVMKFSPGGEDEVLRMEDLDHSKLKFTKADGICTLNQTFAERKAGRARFWVDKTRRWGSSYLIEMEVDYTTSTLRELKELQYEPPQQQRQARSNRDQGRKGRGG